MNKIILILGVLLFSKSCFDENKDGVICTEIFASVTIEVTGSSLDDYYTVRASNNDTIRINEDLFGENVYTVLDDNYMPELRNDRDEFTFFGIIAGQAVVSEKIVISADECHITKISGKDIVIL
ncbi:MAG: hypothetical protein K8R54_14390 [Bacteroidales bacterium]|nr:hypothetical protein [Bacteroidales bacterium]